MHGIRTEEAGENTIGRRGLTASAIRRPFVAGPGLALGADIDPARTPGTIRVRARKPPLLDASARLRDRPAIVATTGKVRDRSTGAERPETRPPEPQPRDLDRSENNISTKKIEH
jgi:hypothetical protein